MESAETYLGAPYLDGGTSPAGFDCSGFVQYVFSQAGASLPRNVREQWRAGVEVEPSAVRPGDLLLRTSNDSPSVQLMERLAVGSPGIAPEGRHRQQGDGRADRERYVKIKARYRECHRKLGRRQHACQRKGQQYGGGDDPKPFRIWG